MTKENKTILTITAILILGVVVLAIVSPKKSFTTYTDTPSLLDGFAKCLTEKGAVMYGADWCPHCKDQKAAFGNSFQYIKYVECPDNTKLCIDKGIQGYPTWIIGTSTKYIEGFDGDNTMKELSEVTQCLLPKNNL